MQLGSMIISALVSICIFEFDFNCTQFRSKLHHRFLLSMVASNYIQCKSPCINSYVCDIVEAHSCVDNTMIRGSCVLLKNLVSLSYVCVP